MNTDKMMKVAEHSSAEKTNFWRRISRTCYILIARYTKNK